jgi:hypothetical protein
MTAFQEHSGCTKVACESVGCLSGTAIRRHETQPGRLGGTQGPQMCVWEAFPVPEPLPVSLEGPPTPALLPGVQGKANWPGQADTISSALGTVQDTG